MSSLESQIGEVEAFLARLGRDLESASQTQQAEEIQRLGQQYAAKQAQLENLVAEWESLAKSIT